MASNTIGIRIVTDASGAVKGVKMVNDSLDRLNKFNGSKGLDNLGNSGQQSRIRGLVSSLVSANLITGALSKGFNMISGSVGGAITRFDKLNTFPKVLTALGASTEDAQRATNKLKDGIDGLPTALQDVTDTSSQMYSVFKDADKAADSTLALNNALLASGSDGEKGKRGIEQYMKILRTGKVEMDSFTTLQETMGIGLDKVAAKLGFTGKTAQNDLYKALQGGQVTIDQFNQALIDVQGGLDGTAALAKTTTAGIGTSFANMRTAVTNGLATMLTKIDEIVQKTTGKNIAGNLDNIKGLIKSFFATINALLDLATPYIIKFGQTLGKMFGDKNKNDENANNTISTADKIKNAFQSLSQSPVFQSVKRAFDSITSSIQIMVQNSMPYVQSFKQTLSDTFGSLVSNLEPAINGLATIVATIARVIGGLVPVVLGILAPIAQGFVEPFLALFKSGAEGVDSSSKSIEQSVSTYILKPLTSLRQIISENQESITKFGEVLGTIAIAFTAFKVLDSVVVGVLTFIKTISTVITVLSSVGTLISNMFAGISTLVGILGGPVTLIIGLIIALGAAFVYCYNTFEPFRNAVNSFFSWLGEIASPIIQAFGDLFTSIWTIITDWWNTNGQAMFNNMMSMFSQVWSTFQTAFGAIAQLFSLVWGQVMEYWNAYGPTLMVAIQAIWIGISTIIKNVLTVILNVISTVWNQIMIIIQTVMGVIEGVINVIMGVITGDWNRAWDGIKQIFESIWNGLSSSVSNILGGIWNTISGILDNIKDGFSKLADIDLWEAGKAIMDSFLKGLKSMWDNVTSFVGDIAGWIADHKGPISYDKVLLIPAGQAIMNGLNAGLQSGFTQVQSTVGGMASKLADSFSSPIGASLSLQTASTISATSDINGTAQQAFKTPSPSSNPVVINIDNVDSDARVKQLTTAISKQMETQYQAQDQFI